MQQKHPGLLTLSLAIAEIAIATHESQLEVFFGNHQH